MIFSYFNPLHILLFFPSSFASSAFFLYIKMCLLIYYDNVNFCRWHRARTKHAGSWVYPLFLFPLCKLPRHHPHLLPLQVKVKACSSLLTSLFPCSNITSHVHNLGSPFPFSLFPFFPFHLFPFFPVITFCLFMSLNNDYSFRRYSYYCCGSG